WTALTRFSGLIKALQNGATSEKTAAAQEERPFMKKLGLNVMAAVIATGADFLLVLALVEMLPAFKSSPGFATALGCLMGGIINFLLNRIVTFRSKDAPLPQIGRYFGVSVCSMLLNAGGVALMVSLPNLDYRIAWWIVRGLVFVLWNYPLHSLYVFGDETAATEDRAPIQNTVRQ
ncbi:MAG: GtrA family protein, partial [Myxococcales bacterium]|nr:GtrA family protein [Myxococcales bacterium]